MHLSKLDDHALLGLHIQEDNPLALGILLKRNEQKILMKIYQYSKNMDDAKDILQETYIRLTSYLKFNKYQNKFLPFLSTMAKNLAIDFYRRKKRFFFYQYDNPVNLIHAALATDSSIEDQIIQEELKTVIEEVLEQLSDIQKDAVVMRYYMGMSFKEIATYEKLSINTVFSRVQYGLKNMKKIIRNDRNYSVFFEKR